MDEEVEWNGEKVKIELGKVNFGDMIDIVKDVIEVKSGKTGSMEVNIKDLGKYLETLLLKSIKKAPFEITVENIRKLCSDDGFRLFTKANELNPLALA